MNQSIGEYLDSICEERPYKIVISSPKDKSNEVRKIVIQLQEHKSGFKYQIEKFTQKQAFHINIEETDLREALNTYFGDEYVQLAAWSARFEHQAKISSKGKLLSNRHMNTQAVDIRKGNNKQKKYCIPEGTIIPPLIDMGVFTKDGKIVRTMYDKYRQINRYLELVEDALESLPNGRINIIDFGCGKSYLTFLLYYYLVEIKKLDVWITGLDLKSDVIQKCQAAADKYHYERLRFQVGDIATYQSEEPVHMVITLHACDTATDYAIYHAIQWKANVILTVPCCQHELNKQMDAKQLSILSKYGILKERSAAIMTDAVRANMLEYCGYKAQVLEFVDMEHSPKNLLIRAVRSKDCEVSGVNKSKKQLQAKQEVEELMQVFGVNPTLYQLLIDNM